MEPLTKDYSVIDIAAPAQCFATGEPDIALLPDGRRGVFGWMKTVGVLQNPPPWCSTRGVDGHFHHGCLQPGSYGNLGLGVAT